MGKIKDIKTPILLDTGSTLTIVNPELLEKLDSSQKPNLAFSAVRLKSANGENIPVLGECPIQITLRNIEITHTVLIADIESNFIIGVDFMMKFSCSICLKAMIFKFRETEIPCFRNANSIVDTCQLVLSEDLVIPPHSEFIAPARVVNPIFPEGNALVEPLEKFMRKNQK